MKHIKPVSRVAAGQTSITDTLNLIVGLLSALVPVIGLILDKKTPAAS